MTDIITAVVTGAVTFAATNIDDIFILMLFYSQTNEVFCRRHIVAGQSLGFTTLIAISLLGFLGGQLMPRKLMGLLGLMPIAIGIRHWLNRNKIDENKEPQGISKSGKLSAVFSVAAVTIANGGDNIGIYTPLFAASDSTRLMVVLAVFYVLLGVWCAVGYFMTRHLLVAGFLRHYGHFIVPFALIGLGVYILIESRTCALLPGTGYKLIFKS